MKQFEDTKNKSSNQEKDKDLINLLDRLEEACALTVHTIHMYRAKNNLPTPKLWRNK